MQIGQEVNAKITEIDFENKRVSLSIRALLEDQKAQEEKEIVEEYNKSAAESEKASTDTEAESSVENGASAE